MFRSNSQRFSGNQTYLKSPQFTQLLQKLNIWSHEARFNLEEFCHLGNFLLSLSGSVMTSTAPEIFYDYCGIARLVTDNRMKIDLRYDNNMYCKVTLKLPQTKTLKLTIDNFRVSLVTLTTFNESFDNFFYLSV